MPSLPNSTIVLSTNKNHETDSAEALRVLRIIDGTTVDGPGFRTSVYLAGCAHRCPGCHNPQSWDFEGGDSVSLDELFERIEENDMDVTFSGGDPIYQWQPLAVLAKRVKDSGRNIWCYTGFKFEELISRSELDSLLKAIDVVVDGPFVESLRDTSLLFRGSSNQRIIDVKSSLQAGKIIHWSSGF